MVQSVLIYGATGETGGDVIDGLLEDGSFDITALVRPKTAESPAVAALKDRGIKIVAGDIETQSLDDIAKLITGYDTIISTVGPTAQLHQLKLVDAAAKAGTKRFIPCGFTTVCPPGGAMTLIRGQKEAVHEKIWYHHLPYTIIDTGFWYQISYPSVPSGKLDYPLMITKTTMYGEGLEKNILVDKRDIGRFVAKIIKDERTVNKRVFMHADVLSQKEIWEVIERKTGEKVATDFESHEQSMKNMEAARAAYKANPEGPMAEYPVYGTEYNVSKYVRADNTPENAKYLGYLSTKDLYPDFKYITFEGFIDDLLAGKIKKMYEGRYANLRKT